MSTCLLPSAHTQVLRWNLEISAQPRVPTHWALSLASGLYLYKVEKREINIGKTICGLQFLKYLLCSHFQGKLASPDVAGTASFDKWSSKRHSDASTSGRHEPPISCLDSSGNISHFGFWWALPYCTSSAHWPGVETRMWISCESLSRVFCTPGTVLSWGKVNETILILKSTY